MTIAFLQNDLALENIIQKSNTIWIAYSGGLDSQVLLHLCIQSKYMSKIKAIHIHHGLSRNADSWVEHCIETCDEFIILLMATYIKINVLKKKRKSLE